VDNKDVKPQSGKWAVLTIIGTLLALGGVTGLISAISYAVRPADEPIYVAEEYSDYPDVEYAPTYKEEVNEPYEAGSRNWILDIVLASLALIVGVAAVTMGVLGAKRTRSPLEPYIFHTVNYVLLAGLCIVMIYPMLNQLALALNEGLDALRGGIRIWPRAFTLENFRVIFAGDTIIPAFWMSVYRTVITVVLNIIITFMLAYALSRREFVLRKIITIVFVLTMYFDPGLIPNFLLIQSLGLLNTFHVYWVPNLIGAFNLIIMRTYIKGVPESLVESARLDGAGEFRICWQVIAPLCKPVIATIALFVAVGAWNTWFDNFIFNLGRQELAVLQFELMRLLSAAMGAGQAGMQPGGAAFGVAQTTPLTIRAAVTIVAAVPILVVYPFLQKYFVSGVQLGGVKE